MNNWIKFHPVTFNKKNLNRQQATHTHNTQKHSLTKIKWKKWNKKEWEIDASTLSHCLIYGQVTANGGCDLCVCVPQNGSTSPTAAAAAQKWEFFAKFEYELNIILHFTLLLLQFDL